MRNVGLVNLTLVSQIKSLIIAYAHSISGDDNKGRGAKATNKLTLKLKFPVNKTITESCDISDALANRFEKKEKLVGLKITLAWDAEIIVDGWGIPYSNPGSDVHDWLLKSRPLGGLSRSQFLRQRTWYVVAEFSVPEIFKTAWFRLENTKQHPDPNPFAVLTLTEGQPTHPMPDCTKFRKALCDAFWSGTGFYEPLSRFPGRPMMPRDCLVGQTQNLTLEYPSDEENPWELPVENLLALSEAYHNALMRNVPSHERARFEGYYKRVPLGIGLLTGVSAPVSN